MSAKRAILTAAVLTEGLLIALSYALIEWRSLSISFAATPASLLLGAAAALPLLALNNLLWRLSLARPTSVYSRFSREVIIPLCRHTPPLIALVIAILSGFAEELFFRGVLNQIAMAAGGAAAAAVVTSAMFAGVHFIGNFRRFGGMMPLYTLVGLYLWTLHALTQSLAAVMVAHGAYNFLAIVMIRWVTMRQSGD